MDQVWPVASTFVRHVVPPALAVAFAGWLLLAHNPLLLDCAAFWTERLVVRTKWFLQYIRWVAIVIPQVYQLPPQAPPTLPPEAPRAWRLCSNGDHSNAEETHIVVCEHFRKILGAILIAAVLSWAAAPTPSPSFISADVVININNPAKADVETDTEDNDDSTYDYASDYLPPRHYRRPPSEVPHGADPRVRIPRNVPSPEQRDVVVCKSTPSTPRREFPPIGASGFAAARKAARAAQNAAADQWVLALRKRMMDENSEAKGLSVGSLHGDKDDEFALVRSAVGLGCSACGE
ncbi:hypothetical protein Sste5346_001485 [Sporothrix stenoceras]|uniref:Uncharacterized protein n=1 Tax=Sporothrix stenoceras TaxID=5173 RepID=A0ABR3ZQP5_9PEZI